MPDSRYYFSDGTPIPRRKTDGQPCDLCRRRGEPCHYHREVNDA